MHSIRSLSILSLALVGAVAVASNAMAHEAHNQVATAASNAAIGKLVPVSDKDASWVAEQKAKYPTTMCVVSDEKLGGDMGKPVDYIYRVEGQPDRLITLCCKDCVKDFNKDPNKYLALLDKAAANKGDKPADAHAKHQH